MFNKTKNKIKYQHKQQTAQRPFPMLFPIPTIDHRSSTVDHRSSIIDHRPSTIDHRSSQRPSQSSGFPIASDISFFRPPICLTPSISFIRPPTTASHPPYPPSHPISPSAQLPFFLRPETEPHSPWVSSSPAQPHLQWAGSVTRNGAPFAVGLSQPSTAPFAMGWVGCILVGNTTDPAHRVRPKGNFLF